MIAFFNRDWKTKNLQVTFDRETAVHSTQLGTSRPELYIFGEHISFVFIWHAIHMITFLKFPKIGPVEQNYRKSKHVSK